MNLPDEPFAGIGVMHAGPRCAALESCLDRQARSVAHIVSPRILASDL
jgi:hypothetical protein